MAIGRLSMKVGKAGKASAHSAYISRSDQYAKYTERGEKLEATEAGNMPKWAEHNPNIFWQSADAFERKNGTTYREMEIALPRELAPEQRIELVHEFIRQEIGNRHAYQFAIHVPTALDGGEQPHVHLMFSERQIDGIDRDPDQYFKRFNAKYPERGGAKKGYGERAGQTLTKAERTEELKALRTRWEGMCNNHLEKAGHDVRIDMRSYQDQGKDIAPEKKQLPSEWKDPKQRAKITEYREAKADLTKTEIMVTPVLRELTFEKIAGQAKADAVLKARANLERTKARDRADDVPLKPSTPAPARPVSTDENQANAVIERFNADAEKRAIEIRLEKDHYIERLKSDAVKAQTDAEKRLNTMREKEPQAPEKPKGFMATTFGLGMKQYNAELKEYQDNHRQWTIEVSSIEGSSRTASNHAHNEERNLSMGGYLTKNARQRDNGALQQAKRDLMTNPDRAKQVGEAEAVLKAIRRERNKEALALQRQNEKAIGRSKGR